MDNIFRKEFPIRSFHLNPSGKARLTTLANFFQEMAYQHANRLGFGYSDLKKNSNIWVLSRMKIEVIRYPVWDETVTLETWHRGMEGLFGMRDFRIRDQHGTDLALAESAWLIVDVSTRRPVRTPDPSFMSTTREEEVFDTTLEKIVLPDKLEPWSTHLVVHSDLDVVGHVNNVKYMEWCIDTFLTPGQPEEAINGIEINFLHEAQPGDSVIITGAEGGSGNHYFAGHLEKSGKEAFRARLHLK